MHNCKEREIEFVFNLSFFYFPIGNLLNSLILFKSE